MHKFIIAVVALSFAAPLSAAAAERPAPKGLGDGASPITVSTTADGAFEGLAVLNGLDPELRKTLDAKGQVLLGEPKKSADGSYAGYIQAVAVFKQPKQKTYELIVEPIKQPLYLPRLEEATAVETADNGQLIRFELSVMFVDVLFHTQHWFYPEHSRVEWLLDTSKKNDIAVQEGFWQLYALGPDTTIGLYGTRVDTGMAVPDFVQDFLARKDIPKALTAFRSYIDSNGAYRRDDD